MFKSLLCAASIAAVLTTVSPALAAEERQSRIVNYGDLDLTSDSGEARLHRRIRAAVSQVCGRRYASTLTEMRAFRRCSLGTMADVGPKAEVAIAAATARSNGTQVALAPAPRQG